MVKKKFIIPVIILIGVGIGLYIWQRSSDPGEIDANAALEKALDRKLKSDAPAPTAQKYRGIYFDLDIPAGGAVYDLKKQGIDKQKDTLEGFSFDLYQPRAIFVATVGGGEVIINSLDDISGATFRKNSPLYKNEPVTISEITGILFTKKETSFEKTIFLVKDHKSYTFSLSADAIQPELETTFATLVSTIVIK